MSKNNSGEDNSSLRIWDLETGEYLEKINLTEEMAVKQKVVDCLQPPNTGACLQVILRDLQNVTSQAQGMEEKMCEQIVQSLGSVPIPNNADDFMQFTADIENVQEILKKHLSNNMIYFALHTLYNEISNARRPLSPAMSIVLQLIHADSIPNAVSLILQNGYPSESHKNALFNLCIWLKKGPYASNLGTLVLAFMEGLEKQGHFDILVEVTMETIEGLFRQLVFEKFRTNTGPTVYYMLSQEHTSVHAFSKIIPYVSTVTNFLFKENSKSSISYLHKIVALCLELMERTPQYSNMPNYEKLNNELQMYLPERPQILGGKSWQGDINLTIPPYNSTVGKVGLNNLGNTCYVNSVLQALFMTKDFRNEVLLHDNIGNDVLVYCMQYIFALLQHSKRSSFSLDNMLNSLRPPGFLPGQQHDSSEFLGYLLDILHEKEKPAAGSTSGTAKDSRKSDIGASGSTQSTTIVQKVFGGRTLSVSSCRQCGTKSERRDSFRELQLSFPNNSDNQSVQTLLHYYLQPEKLSGDNQYHCDICQGLTDGERVTSIEAAPRRLILTLKHFRYDPASQLRTKLLQIVKLDGQVHLEDGQYHLYAAVVHCGSSVDSGHYYTFAKDGEEWFKFNDGFVTRSNADELYNLKPPETPYILFYRREDCVDPESLQCEHLSYRLRNHVLSDNSKFEAEKTIRPIKTYNTRQNGNDDPPPPSCGGFANNSSNKCVF